MKARPARWPGPQSARPCSGLRCRPKFHDVPSQPILPTVKGYCPSSLTVSEAFLNRPQGLRYYRCDIPERCMGKTWIDAHGHYAAPGPALLRGGPGTEAGGAWVFAVDTSLAYMDRTGVAA